MRRIVNTNRQVVVNGRQDRNVAVAGMSMLRGGDLLACLRLFAKLVAKKLGYAAEHPYQPAYQCAHAAAAITAASSRGASCWRPERPSRPLAFAGTT